MNLTNDNDKWKEIESRLAKIESVLHITPKSQTAPTQTPAVTAKAQEIQRSTRSGNWLGVVGAICFVIAAGFIIKLSIDSGWLTPVRQIGLAILLGVSLIVSGLALMKADREYAGLLPAAGVIILYSSVFAAHQYYSLITFQAAIVLTAVISLICIGLYRILHHDFYALVAAAGAYLAPVILELNAQAAFSIYYYLICSFAFATIAIWLHSRLLILVAAYLALFVNAYIGFNLGDNELTRIHLNQSELIAIILPIHFLIFLLASYLYTIYSGKELTKDEAWSFFPVLVAFYSIEYYFIYQIRPDLAPWISLIFAAAIFLVYLGAKTWLGEKSVKSQTMIFAFISIVIFHSVYLELLPTDFKPWLFVIIFMLAALIPAQMFTNKNKPEYKVPIFALLLILGIEYLSMIYHMIGSYNQMWVMVTLASFASIWFLLIMQKDLLVKDEYNYALLSAAHLLAITAFYQLTTDYGSLAVSASWLLYAVIVIAFAFTRKDKVMARSAIFVLGFAAGKALLYDVASAPTVVRILCLLLTGAVLYGSGFLMKRISSWTENA